jgi:PAS domain S-box-containing protein
MGTTHAPATERGRLARLPIGTKLLLLAILPVCCVVALVVVSAASDYRSAHRLSRYRAEARLSFALWPLAVDLAHERRYAVMARLDPGPTARAQLVAGKRATTRAFEEARAHALRVAAPIDVVGNLDASRRQRQALLLQLDAGSLDPAEAIAGYTTLTTNVLAMSAALDRGAPSPRSARAAGAYGSILQAIESSSRERSLVATLLAPRGDRRQPPADPWGALEAAELDAFRQNAAGSLVADLEAVLFSPAGTAVQRFRDELAKDPAHPPRMTLQRWMSIAGTRIDALRAVAAAAGRDLDRGVSDELHSAHIRAARDLTLSLAALALVTSLALALRRSITGPLRQVSAAARGLARGDIATRVTYASKDELGDVAAAFRDVHATAARLVDEIRAENRAVKDGRLDHRADTSGVEGVWSQLLAGLNDTMAAFSDLHEQRRSAERESERIFEMSRDALCVIGSDTHLKRVNPAMERMLGYSRDGLTRRPMLDFIHPDDRERTREALSALGQGEHTETFESRVISADGSVRWLQWNGRAVPEEGLIYGVGRDITESRRAREEQAALRRVATLVARDVAPEIVFEAVAEEVGKVLPGVDMALVARYLPDESIEFVGGWSRAGETDWVGTTTGIGGKNVSTAVFETMQPARIDHLGDDAMPITAFARGVGARSSAGAPITIEGRLWGLMIVASAQEEALAEGIEHELAGFIELVATAIANAQAREELAASRARIVTAGDEARRRIERDLHDGVQQRLVVLGLELQAARALANGGLPAHRQLEQIGQGLTNVVDELREISNGIHPAVLTHGGLRAGIRALARRAPVPVKADVPAALDLPDQIEVAAYYVASEAFTNAAKHAHAASIEVRVSVHERELELMIHDDGVGGATVGAGSGLIGLIDRVQAVGGRIEITSPRGGGTTLDVGLPLASTPIGSLGESA